MTSAKYWPALEAINRRIDVQNPDPADLIELAEISRYRNQELVVDREAGTSVQVPGKPRVLPKQVGEFGFDRIRRAAEFYAETYHGDFDFMAEMRREMAEHGRLTVAQTAGVLNCMIVEAKAIRRYRFSASTKNEANPERSGSTEPAKPGIGTTGRFATKKRKEKSE